MLTLYVFANQMLKLTFLYGGTLHVFHIFIIIMQLCILAPWLCSGTKTMWLGLGEQCGLALSTSFWLPLSGMEMVCLPVKENWVLSPQKPLEMSASVLKNTHWCGPNCGWPFGGLVSFKNTCAMMCYWT